MATEGSSSSTFPVFVDTNLETHLLILVSSDDSVADLKGKIRTEHLLSFPDIGEISVQTMKVKRRGYFYCLSNSMAVRRAFEGIKGARFLHTDLVPTSSIVKSQTELAKAIMNESDVQPDKYNLLKTGHDANLLAIKGEDRHRDSIVNGLATEKGLIGTSVSSVLESETLPGLVKRQGHEVPEMEELIIEGDAAVGSRLQQKSKPVAGQENKDGSGEVHENAGIGVDMGVLVARKKEKSRKRRNALEIDQLPDGKSEHPNVEKKKHKKEKDGSSRELVKESVMPEDSVEEKHDNKLVSSEGFPCKPSQVDSSLQAPVDAKQKRKKKKHISINDETPQNQMVDSSLNKTDDATQGNQAVEDDHAEPVNNHADLRNESDAVDLTEESTQKMLETVFPENRVQEKHGTNLVSSEGIPSKPSDIDSSFRAPVDAKQKRKKKKHISKNDETSHNEMVNSSLNKTDHATLRNQAVQDDHSELVKNNADLRNESDPADLMEESTQKMLETVFPENRVQEKHGTKLVSSEGIHSKPSDVDSSLRAPVDTKQKRKKKKHISKNDETSQNEMVDSSLNKTDDATKGNQAAEDYQTELVNNHAYLRNESDTADLMEESTQKMLETVFPENGVQEKHGSNLMSSEGIPSIPSDVGASLRAPVDAKLKRKKKKHLSKSDIALENDMVDKSLDEANDAFLGKQPFEENCVEELVKNHTELGKESDATNDLKEGTPKKHDGRSEELRMVDPLSAKESTDNTKPSTDLPVQDENFCEASGNNHAQLNKVADVVITDADLANKSAMESGIPSEIGVKSSHRSKRKKREKAELPNTQSNPHETVNSSKDQVPEEIQNKTSSTHQEQLVGSSTNERKKKCSQKKSEEMELHQESNLQSGTLEAVNSSVDRIIGELSKEISIKHLETASLQEAVENSTTVQSIVPSNPNDKKSKRSRKNSDKIELPFGDPFRAESVQSLLDEATKKNPEESLKGTHNKTLGHDLGHQSKDSEVAAADSTVPLNPSDKKSKRSRKKSGKIELPNEEYFKDEGVHSLEKDATKENPGGTLTDISTGMDINSKSATVLREAAGFESVTELNLVTTSIANGINSSRNYGLDHSIANERTNENLEIISGNSNKSSGNEHNARINPDETGLRMDHANISNFVPTGFNDSSGNYKSGHLSEEKANTIGLEKAGERSMETVHDTVHNTSAQAEDHTLLTKSDSANINSIKFSDPNVNQPEEVQGPPSVETETNKTNKEKTKRKKKLNLSPQDSTINLLKPLVSSEQQVLKKKPQDSGFGIHGSVASVVENDKEQLKSRKNHENRTQKSDMHLYDTSSDLGSHVDDKIERKLKHHGSNTYIQGSLRVEKKSKHPIGKNSTSTGSKLQPLTHEDTDTMVYVGEVSKRKIDDASIRSSSEGAAVVRYSSSAVANIPPEENMASLVASSDSTEDNTPIQKKRYKVAARKVPTKRYENVSNKSNEEKTLLAASATIFSDASSGSSEDEFETSNRRLPVRATSGKSPTSTDSDGDLEETQTAYKNSAAGSESTEYHKVDRGTNVALNSPTKSSNVRRGKPLSAILKSSSSYKRAKLTASQSEFEDSESQPFDIVPETQHE